MMPHLMLVRLADNEYINAEEISSIVEEHQIKDLTTVTKWTMIILKNGTRIPVRHTVSEVIGFIRTQTQDIFSIS